MQNFFSMRNKINFSACIIIVCVLTISQFQLSITVNHKNKFRASNKQNYFLSREITFFNVSSFILLHNAFPCRIINVTNEPIQDDGTFKVNIQGEDIFTHKLYNQTFSSTAQGKEVIVMRNDYQILDISDDFLSLLDANGAVRTDLSLPNYDERDQQIADCIVVNYQNDKVVYVSVLETMGNAKISDCKPEQ